jgi:hypothetical protein
MNKHRGRESLPEKITKLIARLNLHQLNPTCMLMLPKPVILKGIVLVARCHTLGSKPARVRAPTLSSWILMCMLAAALTSKPATEQSSGIMSTMGKRSLHDVLRANTQPP